MRPWIVFLVVTVKQFDVSAEDLKAIGLTDEEIEFLTPAMLEKVSCPKMSLSHEDTEFKNPKFAALKKLPSFAKFQDAYLLTKRTLKGTRNYEKSLQDVLSMLFYISDVIENPDHPDKKHVVETMHIFRELTIEMCDRPTKTYKKAAFQMEECLKSAILQ